MDSVYNVGNSCYEPLETLIASLTDAPHNLHRNASRQQVTHGS